MKKTQLVAFAGACVLATAASVSAAVVDLTTMGASGTANGALFQQITPQSTGTGVIDPFLRVQGNGIEAGLNTGNTGPTAVLGETKTGSWTHELLLSAVPKVTIGGTEYYQFLLDINQQGGDTLLSLHELEIWTKSGTLAEANSYDDLAAGGAIQRFDLDSGVDGDSRVELDFDLNPGSGAGDMFAYIPVSALGIDGTLNVYLYCVFGTPNDSNDGFEEWAVLQPAGTPPPGVPDASTSVALLGMGLLAVGTLKRRFLS